MSVQLNIDDPRAAIITVSGEWGTDELAAAMRQAADAALANGTPFYFVVVFETQDTPNGLIRSLPRLNSIFNDMLSSGLLRATIVAGASGILLRASDVFNRLFAHGDYAFVDDMDGVWAAMEEMEQAH